jgi:hypothetical protein
LMAYPRSNLSIISSCLMLLLNWSNRLKRNSKGMLEDLSKLENNPEITQGYKMAALKLAADISCRKFEIFTMGPSMMQIDVLKDKVKRLKEETFDEKGNLRHLPYPWLWTNNK